MYRTRSSSGLFAKAFEAIDLLEKNTQKLKRDRVNNAGLWGQCNSVTSKKGEFSGLKNLNKSIDCMEGNLFKDSEKDFIHTLDDFFYEKKVQAQREYEKETQPIEDKIERLSDKSFKNSEEARKKKKNLEVQARKAIDKQLRMDNQKLDKKIRSLEKQVLELKKAFNERSKKSLEDFEKIVAAAKQMLAKNPDYFNDYARSKFAAWPADRPGYVRWKVKQWCAENNGLVPAPQNPGPAESTSAKSFSNEANGLRSGRRDSIASISSGLSVYMSAEEEL